MKKKNLKLDCEKKKVWTSIVTKNQRVMFAKKKQVWTSDVTEKKSTCDVCEKKQVWTSIVTKKKTTSDVCENIIKILIYKFSVFLFEVK